MMLLCSDVPECAPDSRGRSRVGHTHELELFFPPVSLQMADFAGSACEEGVKGLEISGFVVCAHCDPPPALTPPPPQTSWFGPELSLGAAQLFGVSLLQSGPAQRRSASAAKLVFAT